MKAIKGKPNPNNVNIAQRAQEMKMAREAQKNEQKNFIANVRFELINITFKFGFKSSDVKKLVTQTTDWLLESKDMVGSWQLLRVLMGRDETWTESMLAEASDLYEFINDWEMPK